MLSTIGKFKLFQGLVLMLVIVSVALFFKFDRQSKVVSDNGKVDGDTYAVGVDYTGVVSDVFLAQGDVVRGGETIATVKSSTLIERLNESTIQVEDLVFSLNQDQEIVLVASQPGRIQKINFARGSFIPANSELAIISERNLYVTADFAIPQSDFYTLEGTVSADIRAGNQRYRGEIKSFEVLELRDSMVFVSARVIPEDAEALTQFQLGTPVVVFVDLKPNPLDAVYAQLINGLAQIRDSLRNL